jgi:nucleoside-diphosphate-sugar epimerase
MLESPSVATLVFGIGYLGSALVQDLLYQGRPVVGLDNLFSTDRRAIDGFGRSPNFQFVEGSITDSEAIDRSFDLAGEAAERVFLLAAQSSAHPDAAPAEYTEDTNLRGPRLVLDAVRQRAPKATVVYASSTRIYGSRLPARVDESSAIGSFTDLSHLSKCYVEKLLDMYGSNAGIRAVSVRLGLIYGIAPVFKTDPRFMTAPNLFCFQAAAGQRIAVRSHDPLAVIHVADAVDALVLAAESSEKGRSSVYNAVGEVVSIDTIAAMVREIGTERELDVGIDGLRSEPSGDTELPAFTTRLTGFVPRRALRDSLAETIDHFLVRGQ